MADAGKSSPSAKSSEHSEPKDVRKLQESVASLSVSLSDRIELLASELRSRWKSGQHIAAESLADGRMKDAWTKVASNEEHLLDLLYHEILIRQEFGEHPESSQFADRFPHLRDRIERLFAVHLAIEDDNWDDMGLDDIAQDDIGQTDDVAEPASSQPDTGIKATQSADVSSVEKTPSGATPQWPRRSRRESIVEPPPGYELLNELGRGGMAVVYRARQQILNRVVALKMLLGGGLASSEVLARIRQEARAVAQLQHPGIVQIYEVGEHNGLPYLSLEYVSGGTLHEWLKGQPLPPMDACRIVEQLALITQFAHERGVVHRDLKPANILLTERPDSSLTPRTELIEASRSSASITMSLSVKIGDFGLARILGHQSDLTATGQVIGTPSYMSPEQAAGTGDEATPAQDVYSLGAILFELLTGRPPFRGATLFDTLEQVRTDEPVPPRRLQPRVSVDLETVCLKCLQKTPERRYQTAQQLADDLRAVQRGEPIQARPATAAERLWKMIRRYPAISGLSVVTLLAVVAGITGVLMESARAGRERDRALEMSQAYEKERNEALAQRQAAEQQKTLAEQQKTLAESARTEAVMARQQAERSLDQSLTAINSLSSFGIELRQTPQQQKTSRRILEETLKLYEQLEKSNGDNTRLRRQLAFTLVRAGEIHSVLRETTKANEALNRGNQLLSEELTNNADDKELWRFLAYSTWVLGNLMKDTGRFPEAIDAYQRSLKAMDEELRLSPGDVNRLRGKANILTNICIVMVSQRKHQEAVAVYEQTLSILRPLVRDWPDDQTSQSELGMVLHDYSEALLVLNRPDDAQRMFDESMAIHQSLFQKKPEDAGNRNLFSRLYMSRGFRLFRAKQPSEALTEFQAAADLLKPLVEAFPTIFEYQQSMINAIVAQLNCGLAAGHADSVENSWKELTDRLIQCRTAFPEERQVVIMMQNWMPDRCEHLVEQGRHAEAVQLHDVLIKSSEWLVLEAATSIEPKPTDPQVAGWKNNLAWYLSIAPLEQLKNTSRAMELIQEALTNKQGDANYLHTLATAQYYAGQYETALQTMATAVQNLPANLPVERRDPMFPALQAMIHARLGNIEDARRQLDVLPPAPKGLSKDGAHLRRVFAEARKVVDAQQAGSAK